MENSKFIKGVEISNDKREYDLIKLKFNYKDGTESSVHLYIRDLFWAEFFADERMYGNGHTVASVLNYTDNEYIGKYAATSFMLEVALSTLYTVTIDNRIEIGHSELLSSILNYLRNREQAEKISKRMAEFFKRSLGIHDNETKLERYFITALDNLNRQVDTVQATETYTIALPTINADDIKLFEDFNRLTDINKVELMCTNGGISVGVRSGSEYVRTDYVNLSGVENDDYMDSLVVGMLNEALLNMALMHPTVNVMGVVAYKDLIRKEDVLNMEGYKDLLEENHKELEYSTAVSDLLICKVRHLVKLKAEGLETKVKVGKTNNFTR